jgi:hypothetical protein
MKNAVFGLRVLACASHGEMTGFFLASVSLLLDALVPVLGEGVTDDLAFLQCFGDGSKNGAADLVLRLLLRVSATVRFWFDAFGMVPGSYYLLVGFSCSGGEEEYRHLEEFPSSEN